MAQTFGKPEPREKIILASDALEAESRGSDLWVLCCLRTEFPMTTQSGRMRGALLFLSVFLSLALPSPLSAQLPNPAQNSVVTFVTDTTITWIWTAVAGAQHYSIWCRDPDGTYGIQYFKCDQTALPTYSVTGLLPGTFVERKVSTDDNFAVTITGTYLSGQTTNTGSGGGSSAADFQMAVTPASATVSAGNPANYSITTTPTAGFARKLGFTCSGPAATTCILSPSSVTLDGRTSVTLTVTLSTQARAGLRPDLFARLTFFAVMITQLSFGLMGIVVGSRPSRHRKAVLICAVLIIFAALTACGAGGTYKTPVQSAPGTQSASGTQAGTYTITITGTTTDTLVPPLSHSVTTTLFVQ
jgi:hypothetical protein